MKVDPDCVNNLASDLRFEKRKLELWQRLESELRAQKAPRILGFGDIFDD